MAASVIGALRVNLGMDSAEFTNGVKSANKSMDRMRRKMANITKVAAAAFAAVTAAAGAAFMKVSSHADKMTKAAQEIGVPVEELTALTHAVELSGGDFGKLQVAIGRFSKNAADSMAGLQSEGVRALDSLGVSLTDVSGNIRPTSELIQDISDRFRAMPDGVQKTALAMQVFGRSGRDLIPMLNQGGEGIRAMMQEARDLGLVITKETGQAAERFNDNLLKVQGVLSGIANAVFSRVIPVMAQLSDRFLNAMLEGGKLKTVVDALTGAFNGIVRSILFVIDNLGTLYNLFKIFVAAQVGVYIFGVSAAFISMARAIRVSGVAMGAFVAVQRMGVKGFAMIAAVVAMASGKMDELGAAIDSLVSKIMGSLPDSVGNFFGDIEGVSEGVSETSNRLFQSLNLALGKFDKAAPAASNLAKSIGSIGTASKDAWQGLREVSETAQETISPIAQTLQSAFSSWIDKAVDGTFKFRDAIADLGKQLIKTFTNRAIQNLFGAILGGVGGTSLAVGGMTLPGFANGGSFNVGGAGGIDSQIVAFRASPNEAVHVTKPNQSMGVGGNVNNTIVNVQNYSGQPVQQRKTRGPNGQEMIDVMIGKSIASGRQDRPMSRFGSKPQALGVV